MNETYIERKPPRSFLRILRIHEVSERTGLSKSTIYNLMKVNRFPKHTPITERCRGWDEDEINDWIVEKLSQGEVLDVGRKRRTTSQ